MRRTGTFIVIVACALAGCGSEDDTIRVQQVPKQPVTTAPAPTMARAPADPAGGELAYTAPESWVKDGPMPMRFASFQIGQGDARANVIITKLPNTAGSKLANFNRWRGEVGLPAVNETESTVSTATSVGGVEGSLLNFQGPGSGAAPGPRRSIVAWIPRGNDWWFFKLLGPEALVTERQAEFESFLKSVSFADGNKN